MCAAYTPIFDICPFFCFRRLTCRFLCHADLYPFIPSFGSTALPLVLNWTSLHLSTYEHNAWQGFSGLEISDDKVWHVQKIPFIIMQRDKVFAGEFYPFITILLQKHMSIDTESVTRFCISVLYTPINSISGQYHTSFQSWFCWWQNDNRLIWSWTCTIVWHMIRIMSWHCSPDMILNHCWCPWASMSMKGTNNACDLQYWSSVTLGL